MKTITFLLTAGILCLTSCNKSKDPDIQTLRSVAADKVQPEYIRKSADIYRIFLEGKAVSATDLERSSAELNATRNDTTFNALVAIFHNLEKQLPEQLPTEQDYMALGKKQGKDKNVKCEINPALSLGILQNILKTITHYDRLDGDDEVNGFFTRFEAKYGSTQAGQYWLGKFRMEWKHALEGRAGNQGKWYSGREKMGLDSPWEE